MIRPGSSARFQVLTVPSPSITNVAQALSRDGETVAVFSQGGGDRSYYWKQSSGFTIIPLMATYTNNFVLGVSKTGSILVGDAFKSGSGRRAWYWSSATGTVALSNGNTAYDVTDTGGTMVIAGSRTNGSRGWRYTIADGMVDLSPLPGGTFSQAYCISDDGNMIGGYSNDTAPYDSSGIPCIWDHSGGDVPMAIPLPLGFDYGQVNSFSDDGVWAVGSYGDSSVGDDYGFIWSAPTGFISLGIGVFPLGISRHGKTIVGTWDTGSGLKAFHMPFGGTPRIIHDSLTQATGISDDGLIVTGNIPYSLGLTKGARVMLVH